MRTICLYLVCLFVGRLCFGQAECANLTKQRASAEASAALDRIIDRVGFAQGSILLFVSSDNSVMARGGAMSLTCPFGEGYERWIVYAPHLINAPARDFVFAHEIAHHVNFQLISGKPWTKEDELQADYNGAQYLVRLGWTKEQLLQALAQLNPAQGHGYPSLEDRKAEVAKAYSDESALLKPPLPPGMNSVGASLKRVIDGVGDIYTSGIGGDGKQTLRFVSFADCTLKFKLTNYYNGSLRADSTVTLPLSEITVDAKQCDCKPPSNHFSITMSVPDGMNLIASEGFTRWDGIDHPFLNNQTDSFSFLSADSTQSSTIVASFKEAIRACKK